MIHKPEISKDFTVEDIHKIREWNYLRRVELGDIEFEKKEKEEFENILKEYPNFKVVTLKKMVNVG